MTTKGKKLVEGKGTYTKGFYKCIINGVQTPEYLTWHNMLARCYSESYQEKFPSYRGCSVCDEWLNFQTFAKWYHANRNEEKSELDKDLRVKGNKIYSPDTCILIPQALNKLVGGSYNNPKFITPGVYFYKPLNKYRASVMKNKVVTHLGYYDTIEEAFIIYKTEKEAIIKEVAYNYYSKGLITELTYNALNNITITYNIN